MLPHAYPLELLQLVGALVGVVLNAYALIQARKDTDALRDSGINGSRKIVADGNVQQELIRLVVQVLLVVVGAASVILPPPSPDMPEMFLWSGYITRVVLLLITFLIAFKSVLDVKDRRTLLRLWFIEQDRRKRTIQISFTDRRIDVPRRDEHRANRRGE